LTTAAFCAFDKPGFLGGTSTWIRELLPDLQARGIEVRCYVFLHSGEKGPVTEYLENHGVECITTRAHYYAEDRIEWLLEKLSSDPVDVFIPNEVPAAYHAARWVKEAGVPVIGVLHTGGAQGEIMQDLFVSGPRSDALTAVVCVSAFIESAVLARNPVDTIVRRIPCGAEIPEARALPPDDTLRIAYVGRLTEDAKRISLLTRSLCAAAREIPGVQATLFGDGPARESVERIIAAEGTRAVKLGGMLDKVELQGELLQTHVIVLLSDYEGLPTAIIEAMACGCVPVCLRISSGVPELVIDGVTGLLVEDRDQSFITAVRRLREDPSLWRRLSENARKHIEAGYSDVAASAAWSNLIEEVAREARPSEIKVPNRIRIPGARPPYESPESRRPHVSTAVQLYRAMRMNLGRVRERLIPRGGTAR
jgi:glycosyltransferase involved in cell wall biosynthesis